MIKAVKPQHVPFFHNPTCSSGSTRALKPDHIHHQQDILWADQNTSNPAKRPYAFARSVWCGQQTKSDEDNATVVISSCCASYFQENVVHIIISEESCIIPVNTPFSILGSTQLLNAPKIITTMDHGHGLVDRMLSAIPLALRPTLTQMESVTQQLSTEDFNECFKNISNTSLQLRFYFSKEVQELLRENIDQFVSAVNDTIREGKVPIKSKLLELLPRMATALHKFNMQWCNY